ncbi:MAG: CRTAC1 family protein [Pirellulales bacterium]|nr:CRTAC1 family protein [Pirellulales bacterium]
MAGPARGRTRRLAVTLPATALLAWLCALSATDSRGQIVLRDVTPQTGITFRHTDGGSGKKYILEYVSAGLALFDYDNDGDDDLYFLNGAPLKGATAAVPPRNALYRNDGGFRFTDVTEQAGVGNTEHGLGVVAGDYDNDGDLDLYLNNYGPNVLYRNDGDGSFTDVTEAAGVGNGDKVGAGVCFLDVDADGDLDLYVANYIKFSYDKHVSRTRMGYAVFPSPRDYLPEPDVLYRNNGDGTFTDVSIESGIAAHAGPGMGMICADYDDDGDTDIFVGNDVEANCLFQNDGSGRFEEAALMAGLAYDLAGQPHGTMAVEAGDYDNDGRLDFHVTSYQTEIATLYRNLGNASFDDVTFLTQAGSGTRAHVTWGNGLVDLDQDGDRDLFIACGHLNSDVGKFDDTSTYLTPNVLRINDGRGRFVDASAASGDGLAVRASSRGAGFADLDNDGDLDIVILNSCNIPTILRNDSPQGNHWLQIRLRGVKSNRDGVGARVKVIAGDLTLIDEVHSGRGYQSHWGTRVHFGLGKRDRADRIEIRWIAGGVDVLTDVPADRCWTITEGGELDECVKP